MSYGYDWTVTYENANSFSFDDTKVQIGGGIQLLGSPFTLVPQLITTQQQLPVSGLSRFFENFSAQPANTFSAYQIVLGGNPYWWNPIDMQWQLSDGTYAQTTVANDIDSNATTLFSDLGISNNQFLSLNLWIATTDPSTTLRLDDTQIRYNWVHTASSAPNQCIIVASLLDLIGNVPLPTTVHPAYLMVSSGAPFFHGGNLVAPFTKSFAFSTVDGTVSASVIETATPGVKLKFGISYYDGNSRVMVSLYNAIVPNEPTATLNSITGTTGNDFG